MARAGRSAESVSDKTVYACVEPLDALYSTICRMDTCKLFLIKIYYDAAGRCGVQAGELSDACVGGRMLGVRGLVLSCIMR